ncbi:hypothetical protein BDV33DRAFT_198715 [Aspergillus novoparasiticus]|uniref:Protein kinase domain-containing protein n=1 Tax=Aspergillus novoparasiticus TaxID=986946 RepID=A0A5N6F699_9EURO|nr:hypothetical protein BDV33DRAFT_198715 [Aspergillus novoparasiticus]
MPSIENVPYSEYQPIEGAGIELFTSWAHGAYSTIWLSRDEQQAVYVAVKISIGDSSPHEADILCATANSPEVDDPGCSMILIIQDPFEIQGPNGCHKCYVAPPAQSIAELALAVAYIHVQGIVHGDIHLGNALIRLPTSFDRLSVEQLYQKFGEPYPEAVMRLDGKPLPASIPARGTVPVWLGKKANEFTLAETHLLLSDFGEAALEPSLLLIPSRRNAATSAMHLYLSRPPFDATLATHEYFEERGEPKKGRFIFPSLEHCFEKEIQAPREKLGIGEFDREGMVAILTMLRSMLVFKPEERATAKAVLGSDWMVTWGLPEFEKVRQT